ncbi:MAG: sigma-70 family RNA polymerase sigma factor, partial [Clostridia bacterium]|nr:sigma-70 family RNA polymerase sigma factor [Clostridia bacterium]
MNEQEIEDIIEYYLTSIRAISRKYYLVGGSDDDLFQEGMIGLLQAIQNFDYNKGDYKSESFKHFALVCIKRQILDAIKKANAKKNMPLNTYISFSQKNSEDESYDLEVSKLLEDYTLSPEEILISKENKEEKMDILYKNLSKFELEVLKHYLAGEKQSETAEKLNKTPKQIDNTI